MKARGVLAGLVVLFVLSMCLSGCSEKDETPPAPEAAPTQPAPQPLRVSTAQPSVAPATVPNVMATAPEPVAVAPSATLEQFLDRKVRMRSVSAGDEIQKFFATWEDILHRRSRMPLDIRFEVDTDGTFKEDHAWENTTSRQILDALCESCNLTWTITEPNTIRITEKTP